MLTRLLRSINTGSRSLGPTENKIFDILIMMTTVMTVMTVVAIVMMMVVTRIVCKILEDDEDNYENVKMTRMMKRMTVITRPLIRIYFASNGNDDGHLELLDDER